jgi:hypothetical protein
LAGSAILLQHTAVQVRSLKISSTDICIPSARILHGLAQCQRFKGHEPWHKLTDAIVEVEGEAMRGVTWATIHEVRSGEWGITGKPLTTAAVKELAAGRGVIRQSGRPTLSASRQIRERSAPHTWRRPRRRQSTMLPSPSSYRFACLGRSSHNGTLRQGLSPGWREQLGPADRPTQDVPPVRELPC